MKQRIMAELSNSGKRKYIEVVLNLNGRVENFKFDVTDMTLSKRQAARVQYLKQFRRLVLVGERS